MRIRPRQQDMREFWSGTWAAMESRQIRSDAGKEAVWYRRTIEAPKTLNGYDLTGVEVSFRFLANANGPIPEILYFNGRRVAMGDNLEQVQLSGDAKPGDKILVAVKLLPTVTWPDPDADREHHDTVRNPDRTRELQADSLDVDGTVNDSTREGGGRPPSF
jgi:hypothetical protein